MNEPVVPRPVEEAAPSSMQSKRTRRIAAIVLLAAVVLAGLYGWYDARSRIGATQDELARRLRDIESTSNEARLIAKQSQESVREAQGKIAVLEGKLAESQSQQLALESLYQELSRNRDEWALAEIEQVLTIAAQQLQLSSNVRAALLALQLAESRLARSDRPQFIPVRKAIARDIERLRNVPSIDTAGVSLRLDSLVAAVDSLPMAFDERTAEAARSAKAAATAEAKEGFLYRFGAEVWDELKSLIRIRSVDAPEPPLLAPSQAYFLRENLKLRILNARLALAMRDEAGFREDIRVAQSWVGRYFDARAKPTAAVAAQLKQLGATSFTFEMPTLSDSLEAVRSFKARRERGGA
jgi:uroporphyrin-3 C-methyltransferase